MNGLHERCPPYCRNTAERGNFSGFFNLKELFVISFDTTLKKGNALVFFSPLMEKLKRGASMERAVRGNTQVRVWLYYSLAIGRVVL